MSGRPPPETERDLEGATTPASVIQRVRGIVQGLDLDRACHTKLDGALQRSEALEDRRHMRRLLLDARYEAERISALLYVARELDEITTEERDATGFNELALLFEDIRDAAARGAERLRSARDQSRRLR